MELTGRPGLPPTWPAADLGRPLLALSDRLAAATAAFGRRVEVDLATLLSGRAALMGLSRGGDHSAGGSARLLRSVDGWVALNLARSADFDTLPAFLALLGGPVGAGVGAGVGVGVEGFWSAAASVLGGVESARAVEAGELLGMAVSGLGEPGLARGRAESRLGAAADGAGGDFPEGDGAHPWSRSELAAGRATAPSSPVVVDLSSLWAGPLCARLLGLAGCRVVKVESTARPDGARLGDPRMWQWLHAGHESRSVDLSSPGGRRDLATLLQRADVVIEASRGRALDQLGLGPHEAQTRPGAVWVSLSGYGRSSVRVAFGDDAAVAAGLVAWDDGGPMFCGDAVGDPIAGLSAAVAASEALADGGGVHLDVSMAAAVRAAMGPAGAGACRSHALRRGGGVTWELCCGGTWQPVIPPALPALSPSPSPSPSPG